MKILVSIIFFLSFFGFTQSLIGVKSIESNLWDLNTKKRISLGYDVRQLCDVSKKASDMQVDYLKQNPNATNEELNKKEIEFKVIEIVNPQGLETFNFLEGWTNGITFIKEEDDL
jgi:hypothetical protein